MRRPVWDYPEIDEWDEGRDDRQIFVGAGFGFCFPRQGFGFGCFPRRFCFPRQGFGFGFGCFPRRFCYPRQGFCYPR